MAVACDQRRQGGAGTAPAGTATALVVGLGRTGLSCARFLAARGVAVRVVDSRARPPALEALRASLPAVEVHLGGFDPRLFTGAAQLVVSPGVSLREPAIARAVEAGVPVLGDIELFAREVRAPVAAITGSNGKSTVTALLGEMARSDGRDARTGGNLGPPALELLGERPAGLYVLELSSFQLETTSSLRAAAATVLNVSPDHMDRYDDLAAYAEAKRRIFRGGGVMVLNRDDARVAGMAEPGRRSAGFTLGAPRGEDYGLRRQGGRAWLARGNRLLLPAENMALRGTHNVANALAALALGEAVGLSTAAMLEVLGRFRGLPHRCQLVATRGGVRFYDDSKATNPGATVAAIRGMAGGGPLVLIAGGDGKGASFEALAAVIAGHVSGVVLLGRDAARIEAAIAGAVPVLRVEDMAQAVRAARRMARPGASVLLSPACASLDMYASYEERGRAFSAAVLAGRDS